MSVKLSSLKLNLGEVSESDASSRAHGCPPEQHPNAADFAAAERCLSDDVSGLDFKPMRHLRGADCLAEILTEIDVTIARTRRAARQSYSLHLQILDDIDFDCSQPFLVEVLWQLVTNAVMASVRAGWRSVDVFATQHKDKLYVQVADQGNGLPAHVIEWFQQKDARVTMYSDHTGAGLVSAAKLIEWAGGQLTLVSTGEKGTRIGFSLPLLTDPRREPNATSP